jgi:hypothetical protein
MVLVLIQMSIDKNGHHTNLEVAKQCQKGQEKFQNEQIEYFQSKAIKTIHF